MGVGVGVGVPVGGMVRDLFLEVTRSVEITENTNKSDVNALRNVERGSLALLFLGFISRCALTTSFFFSRSLINKTINTQIVIIIMFFWSTVCRI